MGPAHSHHHSAKHWAAKPVIVVVGASGGIGEAIALEAAKKGARVVLVGRRPAELEAISKKIADYSVHHSQTHAECLCITADATVRHQVENLVAQTIAHFGDLNVLINVVGRGITSPVSTLTDEDIDTMIQINVKSAVYGMQAVLPHFKSKNSGHIINISSMLGRVPFVYSRSAYSASKAYLNSLSASLREELYNEFPGIHVSTVLCGTVATDFGKNALHGGSDSRSLPNAQSAESVAEVVMRVIETKKPEVYTAPYQKEAAVAYYSAEDVSTLEKSYGIYRGAQHDNHKASDGDSKGSSSGNKEGGDHAAAAAAKSSTAASASENSGLVAVPQVE